MPKLQVLWWKEIDAKIIVPPLLTSLSPKVRSVMPIQTDSPYVFLAKWFFNAALIEYKLICMINFFLNRLADITYLQYVYIWGAPSVTN